MNLSQVLNFSLSSISTRLPTSYNKNKFKNIRKPATINKIQFAKDYVWLKHNLTIE